MLRVELDAWVTAETLNQGGAETRQTGLVTLTTQFIIDISTVPAALNTLSEKIREEPWHRGIVLAWHAVGAGLESLSGQHVVQR